MQVVRAHFRPEFLNRVDEIILFNRLRREDMGAIVDIQVKRLQKLLEDRKITLRLDAKARDWLAAKGYDPTYGARPLKRVMQKELQDTLAERLLAGEIIDGATSKFRPTPRASSSTASRRIATRRRRCCERWGTRNKTAHCHSRQAAGLTGNPAQIPGFIMALDSRSRFAPRERHLTPAALSSGSACPPRADRVRVRCGGALRR